MTDLDPCGCRCHGGGTDTYCCPECEPEAYDTCGRCGLLQYQHNQAERAGSPGACARFYDEAEDRRLITLEREAAGQVRWCS